MPSLNVSTIRLESGVEVCLSYGVIVAAWIPSAVGRMAGLANLPPQTRGGLFRTKNRYSPTTSRHMNQFAGKDAPEIDHAELLELCKPIVSRL